MHLRNRSAPSRQIPLLEHLEQRALLAVTLVNDSNLGTASSSPSTLIAFKGRNYFLASDADHGRELWSTDGTPEGSALFFETRPGPANGAIDLGGYLQYEGRAAITGFVAGDYLYFLGFDNAGVTSLWRTDGTVDGTLALAGSYPLIFRRIPGMAALGNLLLFANGANSAGQDIELWVSDGTPEGTHLLKDINPGIASAFSNNYEFFTVLNDSVFFFANDGAHGRSLWKTDGTANGTQLVRAMGVVGEAVVHNGLLYFTGSDGSFGTEIWKSDGTTAGTVRVTSIYPNGGFANPSYLTHFKNWIYFRATDPDGANHLWRTDGTSTGTTRVSTANVTGLRASNTYVYYTTAPAGSTFSTGVFKTDGVSPSLTVRANSNIFYLSPATDGDRILFFAQDSGGSGFWISRAGAAAGSTFIKGPAGFTQGSDATCWLDGAFYFSARDPDHGQELWKYTSPTMTFATLKNRTLYFNLSDEFTTNLNVTPTLTEVFPNMTVTSTPPMVFDVAHHQATWTIPFPNVGYYRLTIPASAITDADGNSIAGNIEYYYFQDDSRTTSRLDISGNNLIYHQTPNPTPFTNLPLDRINAFVFRPTTTPNRTVTLSSILPSYITLDLANVALVLNTTPERKAADLAALQAAVAPRQITSSLIEGNASRKFVFSTTDTTITLHPTIVGDLNFDNTVSIADFVTLASHFGVTDATWEMGDFNGDRLVTIADFIELSSNFGQTLAGAASPPQPAADTALLLKKSRRKSHHHHKPTRFHPKPAALRWRQTYLYI